MNLIEVALVAKFCFILFLSENFFEKEVFSMCYINIPQRVSNEVLDNILNYPVNKDTLISILTNSLLKIIPNIILNKREDAIPLIVSAVDLNENVGDRDKLLQLLFNLKKKPSETERTLILTGKVIMVYFVYIKQIFRNCGNC